MASKELELVPFVENVVAKGQRINDWLTALEKAVCLALATTLATAVKRVKDLMDDDFAIVKYKSWLNDHQAQLVVLAAQVAWSESVEAALGGATKNLQPVVGKVKQTLHDVIPSLL